MLIPTRGRNQNHLDLVQSWRETTEGNSVLVFGLDDDDAQNYEQVNDPDIIYEVLPKEGKGMGWITNKLAQKYARDYPYVGFMGDDHRFRNKWETPFLELLNSTPYGIAYGNDLTRGTEGSGLPSAAVLDAEIINKLGYMFPPGLKHLMIDVYWKQLGNAKGTLLYLPYVHIEHVHPFVEKAAMDEQYQQLNDQALLSEDNNTLGEYNRTQFNLDLEKLS